MNKLLDKLVEIVQNLNLIDLEKRLLVVKNKMADTNPNLILPLIGEYSSGKTTLLNALTNSKCLETGPFPTTSTIYEVHFSSTKVCVQVHDENGECSEIEDFHNLKNEVLSNSKVVSVYDTSTRIDSMTILVDTPGLSSPNPLHRQTLVDFLPNADGVLLIIDINQQITRSITDFVEIMNLLKKPIFLVITHCDTKSTKDQEITIRHICSNCNFPIRQIACVAAQQNELSEFYQLIENIQSEKKQILSEVNAERIKIIANEISARIDELLSTFKDEKVMDEAIKLQEHELCKIKRNIDKLIERIKEELRIHRTTTTRKFEETIIGKLETLVVGKSANFDSDAISIINNTISVFLSNFKNDVYSILKEESKKDFEGGIISFGSLSDINMSSLSINEANYNLSLNTMGHEYDKTIASIAKVAIVAGVTASVASAVSASKNSAASTVPMDAAIEPVNEASLLNENAIDIVDTVSDIASIVSNSYGINGLTHQSISPNIERKNTGIIESLVGLATDKAIGKPQRRRAIYTYINESLLPDFNKEMERLGNEISSMISETLYRDAEEFINQKKSCIQQMKDDYEKQKDAYNKKIILLNTYQKDLKDLAQ